MRKLFIIALLLVAICANSQTFDPAAAGVPTNKAISFANATPADSRSMFWDAANFVYRAYTSVNEVYSYLNLSKYRSGHFPIIVNSGGVLGGTGVITGGTNTIYWFKDGTANANLVPLQNIISVNGQTGAVLVKNADSLMTLPIDTSARRNNYALTYDSTNRKWYLAPAGSGQTYTAGVGVDITDGIIKALNSSAIWNASQLRGRNISATAPNVGQIPKWDGTFYTPSQDNTGLESGYWSNDTLYLISDGDTTEIFISLTPVGDNWGTQTVATDAMFFGAGLSSDELKADTVIYFATKTDIAALEAQIAAIVPGAGGPTTSLFNSLIGDTISVRVNDSTYRIKSLRNGTNVSFSITDTTITINSTPGTAEINDNDSTISANGNMTVSVESIVDYILVKPASNLAAFKVGTLADDDIFIPSTPVLADGEFQMLIAPFYLPASTAIYFAGITSSTDIQIIFKPLHR
jgi:hypothetical protein